MRLTNYTLEMNTKYDLDDTGDLTLLITELHGVSDNAELQICVEGYFSVDAIKDRVRESFYFEITKADLYSLLAFIENTEIKGLMSAFNDYLYKQGLRG